VKGLWLRKTGRYKGRRVHSSPGTQEAAIQLLLRHALPRASVLDLASGGGAMVARLRDAGFSDLHEVVRDPKVFGEGAADTLAPAADPRDRAAAPQDAASIPALDFSGNFADHFSRRFGLVVASEVIEHLESPRDFLKQAGRLLETDGLLLLTTPNVSNWVGRVRFFLFGELRWFDERMYRQARHISPLTDFRMRALLAETGFELVASTSAGYFYGPLRTLLTAPIALPFVACFGRRGWGDCNVYLARTSVRTSRLPGVVSSTE